MLDFADQRVGLFDWGLFVCRARLFPIDFKAYSAGSQILLEFLHIFLHFADCPSLSGHAGKLLFDSPFVQFLDFFLGLLHDGLMLLHEEVLYCGSAFHDIFMDFVPNFAFLLQFGLTVRLDEFIVFEPHPHRFLFDAVSFFIPAQADVGHLSFMPDSLLFVFDTLLLHDAILLFPVLQNLGL